MKRLLSVLLVVAMTAALLACSPASPAGTTAAPTTDDGASSGVFKAGIGISNITPSDSVSMQGCGQEDKHMSNGFASYIYVYCLAVQDSDGNTAMDHLFEEATAIYNHWLKYNLPEAAMKMATSGQIHEFRHAEAIVSKAKAGPTRELKIPAISFGDIGVTGGPYEMFDTNGMQIKESAPMAMTIMCNMANGNIGYVPSQLGYDNGGYSTDITRLAPGSGEKLAQVMIDTLTQHRNAQ